MSNENNLNIEYYITKEPQPSLMGCNGLALPGPEIARRSHEYIDQVIESEKLDNDSRAIIRRVIHSTADFSFAKSVKIHPLAVDRGLKALAAGKPIICDVNMVKSGITSVQNDVICKIRTQKVFKAAKKQNITRAAAAMEVLKDHIDGSIVVIGNAPTALFKIIEITANGGPKPAVVIGLPVGFVGARESKFALINSGLCYITNTSCKGGSPVAAAAMNALAYLPKEEHVI